MRDRNPLSFALTYGLGGLCYVIILILLCVLANRAGHLYAQAIVDAF